MTKQKTGVVIGSVIGGIALLGGAFWLGSSQLLTKETSQDNLSLASGSAGPSQNVMPLGGEEPKQDSGGLSVTNSSGASNLGQLGGNTGGSQSSGSSGAGASG